MSKRHPGSWHYAALNSTCCEQTHKAAFQSDGYRCRVCGKAGRFEAHHEPKLTAGSDPCDPAGVLTYCQTSNIERHRPDTADAVYRGQHCAGIAKDKGHLNNRSPGAAK